MISPNTTFPKAAFIGANHNQRQQKHLFFGNSEKDPSPSPSELTPKAETDDTENLAGKTISKEEMKRRRRADTGVTDAYYEANSKQFEVISPEGRALHFRRWSNDPKTLEVLEANVQSTGIQPETADKGAVLLLVHGLSGRSSWMTPLANQLLPNHSRVYGIDLPQIGQSKTGEGHFNSVDEMVDEVSDAVIWLSKKHQAPVFVAGLSLGGLISTFLATRPPRDERRKSLVNGVILMAPAYKGAGGAYSLMNQAKFLGRYFLEKVKILPRSYMDSPVASPLPKTHSKEKLRLVMEHLDRVEKLSTHAWIELHKAMKYTLPWRIKRVETPVLMFVPEKDTVCDPETMRDSFDKIPVRDKQLMTFANAYHDLIFEPEMPEMAREINRWISQHNLK